MRLRAAIAAKGLLLHDAFLKFDYDRNGLLSLADKTLPYRSFAPAVGPEAGAGARPRGAARGRRRRRGGGGAVTKY